MDTLFVTWLIIYFIFVISYTLVDMKVSFYHLYIFLTLFLGAVLSYIFWKYSASPALNNLGLNLFTEVIGISVTIALINFLFKKYEEEKLIPRKLALYQEINTKMYNTIGFCKTLYSRNKIPHLPDTIDSFLSSDNLRHLWINVDLSNISPGQPFPETDSVKIIRVHKRLRKKFKRILIQYCDILEPDIYLTIHNITMSDDIASLISHPQSIKELIALNALNPKNIFQFKNLSFIAKFDDNFLQDLLKLYKWCETFFNTYGEQYKIKKNYTY